MSALRLANAPVSYGAFELTAGGGFDIPDAEQVLAAIAEAGYEGTELGPPGYLGDADTLRERLDRHGLELVAGFVPVHFADAERTERDLESQLATVLDLFDAAGATSARPVLADAPEEPESRLSPGGLARLAQNVQRAADTSRARGFEPAFHHHGGSYVETPGEIEAVLDGTDVDLLVDTGHLLLAGGDPVQAVRDWGSRIGHVHLKDVRLEAVPEGAGILECWRRGAFCELGRGDVDLDGFLSALGGAGYEGWLVVEQDRILASGQAMADADAAQRRNRRWLDEHLEPLRA